MADPGFARGVDHGELASRNGGLGRSPSGSRGRAPGGT